MGNFKSISELMRFHQIDNLAYLVQDSTIYKDIDQRKALIENTLGCCRHPILDYDQFMVFSTQGMLSARTLLERLDGYRDTWDGDRHPVGTLLYLMYDELVKLGQSECAEQINYFTDIINRGIKQEDYRFS